MLASIKKLALFILMNLEVLRKDYLEYSKRFKSDGAYRFDKSHLNFIINYFIEKGYKDTEELTFESIYDFIDSSRDNDNSNNTINKRINLLQRAITFFIKIQRCTGSQILNFPKLKEVDKRYSIIDERTMIKLIKYMLSLDNSEMNLRNKCIIFLFIDTGMRLSELTNVKISNIDFRTQSILLDVTKTKRDRVVYFSSTTSKYIQMYIKIIDTSIDYLFRNSRNNEPIKYRGVIRAIDKIRDELGIKQLSSHMIRHSYGTLAYKLNVSTLFTKNTMGHARVEMTERYTHYDIDTNRKIYDGFAPVEHYINKDN